MKVEGLGDQRRSELFQIRALVEEAKGFSSDQFERMVDQYKTQDKILHQILSEAKTTADSNYTRYLNGILVRSKMGFDLRPLNDADGETTILSKVMGELREQIKNENEYRKQFLGPQIGKQMQAQEIVLRKIQKEEIKRQREELKALSRSQTKGLKLFSFGR